MMGTQERETSTGGNGESVIAGMFRWENMKVGIANVIGGTLNGYSIGFVAIYSTLYEFSTDCAAYTTAAACSTVMNSACDYTSANQCLWKGEECQATWDLNQCTKNEYCFYNYADKKCSHQVGYKAWEAGVFAGAMILGAVLGSFLGGEVTRILGYKRMFMSIGGVSALSAVLTHFAASFNIYWLLVASRVILGVTMGATNVSCPMFVDQMAPPKYKHPLGVLFQVFTTFGIMLAALLGLALGQSVKFDQDPNLNGRFQGFIVFLTALSLLMVGLGMIVSGKDRFNKSSDDTKDAEVLDPNEYSFTSMLRPILVGWAMSGALQLTGINAIMNFAPKITKNLGLTPLVGNFVIMAWNFVTTFASIPLVMRMPLRRLFLICVFFGSLACLLTGIPLLPSVGASDKVINGIGLTGILLFILFFETGIGPCYFVLSQELFPPSFRPRGGSSTLLSNFVFNLIINVCFPIAVEGLSGGPSGDQNLGLGITFVFFCVIGLLCGTVCFLWLHPFASLPSSQKEENQLAPNAAILGIKIDGNATEPTN